MLLLSSYRLAKPAVGLQDLGTIFSFLTFIVVVLIRTAESNSFFTLRNSCVWLALLQHHIQLETCGIGYRRLLRTPYIERNYTEDMVASAA
jgi:hypothetical protein